MKIRQRPRLLSQRPSRESYRSGQPKLVQYTLAKETLATLCWLFPAMRRSCGGDLVVEVVEAVEVTEDQVLGCTLAGVVHWVAPWRVSCFY